MVAWWRFKQLYIAYMPADNVHINLHALVVV